MIAMVPLQLVSLTSNGSNVIWSNSRPSSTRLCRPIKFRFAKESENVTNQQYQETQSKIDGLRPFVITNRTSTIEVTYDLKLTMIDGKTLNCIGNNRAQQNCPICGATPSQMNNLKEVMNRKCRVDLYNCGLSTLHCWIRFLEYILHIAYRLPFKKWAAEGVRHKSIMEYTKRKIQQKYKSEKDLLLDFVRHGSGTSNDGNTARRFIEDPTFAANVTGVHEDLIHRFHVILTTMCCGRNVNNSKFENYCIQTAELYVTLYKWYYMPASVHKVLIQGSAVIKALSLPIGVYSEEAQEARNKEFQWIREHNTRKVSRRATNEDIIHGLLVSSYPVISNFRQVKNKEHKELDEEVLHLLLD